MHILNRTHPQGHPNSVAKGTSRTYAFGRRCERELSAKVILTAVVPVGTPTLETPFLDFYVFSLCLLGTLLNLISFLI